MGRLVIRPDDLRILAQRFDVAADDVRRVRRRLNRDLPALVLNNDDPGFEAGRFRRRANLVLDRLHRSADGMHWDATVMAQSANDGEAADGGAGVIGDLGVGWAPETLVQSWSTVAGQLGGFADQTAAEPSNQSPSAGPGVYAIGPGGLFLAASRSGGAASTRVLGRLAEVGRRTVSDQHPDWGGLWRRIAKGLPGRPSDPEDGAP